TTGGWRPVSSTCRPTGCSNGRTPPWRAEDREGDGDWTSSADPASLRQLAGSATAGLLALLQRVKHHLHPLGAAHAGEDQGLELGVDLLDHPLRAEVEAVALALPKADADKLPGGGIGERQVAPEARPLLHQRQQLFLDEAALVIGALACPRLRGD